MISTSIRPCPSCGHESDLLWPPLTLRDWFAGLAMQGLLTSGQKDFGIKVVQEHGIDRDERITISERAYELADALLTQRGRT